MDKIVLISDNIVFTELDVLFSFVVFVPKDCSIAALGILKSRGFIRIPAKNMLAITEDIGGKFTQKQTIETNTVYASA